MTRLQWISALQLAADHSGAHQSYQRLQAAKRRQQRQGLVQEMIQARLVPTYLSLCIFVFISLFFYIIFKFQKRLIVINYER